MLRRLPETCRRHRMAFSSITLDRGFYSAGVINPVKEVGIRIMPAVKHDRVKDLKGVRCRKAGCHICPRNNIKDRRDCVMHAGHKAQGKTGGCRACKVPREADRHGRQVPHLCRQHERFPDGGGGPDRAAEFYRKRRGMENSYKCYEQMRPRTTTSHTVRTALRFIPFLLYNMRILARFMTGRRHESDSWRPPYTLQLFTTILPYAALEELGTQKRRPPDQTA